MAWKHAIERKTGPSCLIFSRQNLPHQLRSDQQLLDIERGGYVLLDPLNTKVELILIATGSEVGLAMDAARVLDGEGIGVRVVSMPCTQIFDAQPIEWREGVLPSWCRARVAIEAGVSDFWRKYVGLDGHVIGIDRFGASPRPRSSIRTSASPSTKSSRRRESKSVADLRTLLARCVGDQCVWTEHPFLVSGRPDREVQLSPRFRLRRP
jgi:transketolase